MASKRANLKNGRAAAVQSACACPLDVCILDRIQLGWNMQVRALCAGKWHCHCDHCRMYSQAHFTAEPSARGLKKTCVLLVLLQCYIYHQLGVPLVVIANNARMPWNREMASMDPANFFLYFLRQTLEKPTPATCRLKIVWVRLSLLMSCHTLMYIYDINRLIRVQLLLLLHFYLYI